MPTLPRRTLLAGLAGLAVAPALAACGSSDAEPAATTSSAPTTFSYTDGRQKKIDLDTVPTVVVAQSSAAAALWDAGFKVKGAYGELTETDGKLNFQAGDLDLSQLTVIGKTYGEFDVEKLAGLGTQLLVDLSFDNKTLWYVDAKVEKQVLAISPTLGIDMPKRNLPQLIDAFTELAVSLGADPAVSAAARGAFETASAELKDAITAGKGLKIAPISLDATNAYIANPDLTPDLAYFKTLGAEFVAVDTKDYFATVSYEELNKYDGDLVLKDARNTESGQGKPTYQALPAVKQGLVFPWYAAAPYSYTASVKVLEALTEAYTKAAAAA